MLNLHGIVRPVINFLHPDEDVILYVMQRAQTNDEGVRRPVYAPGVPIQAQVQTESDSALYHSNRMGENNVTRRFYVFFKDGAPLNMLRPGDKGGDIIYRPKWNTWWLMSALPEDFTGSGWVRLRGTLLVKKPPEIEVV